MLIPGFNDTFYNDDFPPHTDVLKYLHLFAEHFNLNVHIKYQHMVTRVRPIANTKWEIVAVNLSDDKHIQQIHDFVFVCNGHFFEPFIPNVQGVAEFQGKLIHSHDFRSAEQFRGMHSIFIYFQQACNDSIFAGATTTKGEDVLLIGMGASGLDLMLQLQDVANRVTISGKKPAHLADDEPLEQQQIDLPPKTILKSSVKRFTNDGVEFMDGSWQSFTTIIYATGEHSVLLTSFDFGLKNYFHCLSGNIYTNRLPILVPISE